MSTSRESIEGAPGVRLGGGIVAGTGGGVRISTDVLSSVGVGEGAEGMSVTVTGEVRTAGDGETCAACWCCVGVPLLEPGLWTVRVLFPSTNGLARDDGFLSAMPPLSCITSAGSWWSSLTKEVRPIFTMGEEMSSGPGTLEGLSPRELAAGLPSPPLSTVA